MVAAFGVTNLGASDPSVVLRWRLASGGTGELALATDPTPGEDGDPSKVVVSIGSLKVT